MDNVAREEREALVDQASTLGDLGQRLGAKRRQGRRAAW